jgi:hypothetical protein
VVVEVAVNNEGPTKFLYDCEAYFSAKTLATTVWIGVKSMACRAQVLGGLGGTFTNGSRLYCPLSNAMTPQCTYTVPTNIVYRIPMAVVFGAGVPIPAGVAATLDIDTDLIRDVILDARV